MLSGALSRLGRYTCLFFWIGVGIFFLVLIFDFFFVVESLNLLNASHKRPVNFERQHLRLIIEQFILETAQLFGINVRAIMIAVRLCNSASSP